MRPRTCRRGALEDLDVVGAREAALAVSRLENAALQEAAALVEVWRRREALLPTRCVACWYGRTVLEVHGPGEYRWSCVECGSRSSHFCIEGRSLRVIALPGRPFPLDAETPTPEPPCAR